MSDKYGVWTVKEIKTELKKRNAKCTGNKEVLIQRLEAYDRNNNFVDHESCCQQEEIPVATFVDWPSENTFISVNKSSIVPQIDIVHINQYFFQVYKGQEGMSMYAAVHRKGYNMMKENFLLSLVQSNTTDLCFYRAQVNSEMTKNMTYFVNIVINLQGNIVEGNCECIAGKGSKATGNCECIAGKGSKATCKHVATVCYAILQFKESESWYIRKTCTDNKQVWHMPKRTKIDMSPLKAEQLNLSVMEYNKKKKELSNMCYDPRPLQYRNMPSYNDLVRNKVINFTNTRKRTLALSGAFPIASYTGLTDDHDYLLRPLAHQFIWNYIQVNNETLLTIEKNTRAQSKCCKWYEERSLRITASNVGTIVHMTERRNKMVLVNTIIKPVHFKTSATEWGKLNERNAVLEYQNVTTKNVIPCGLFISPEHCFLAGSPDGLVCSLTVLEVKCPYSIRDQFITAENLDYLEIKDGALSLKCNSNYYYQVQTQMYVTNRNFCDFCVWTTKDFKILSVSRNDEVINKIIIPKTEAFYNDYVVPALAKKFYSLNLP